MIIELPCISLSIHPFIILLKLPEHQSGKKNTNSWAIIKISSYITFILGLDLSAKLCTMIFFKKKNE
jgi:hypothetical protein